MNDKIDLDELVCSTLARACRMKADQMGLQTRMSDLRMDSLTFVAVVAQVEAVCEFNFSSAEVMQLLEAQSVGTLIDHVRNALGQRA